MKRVRRAGIALALVSVALGVPSALAAPHAKPKSLSQTLTGDARADFEAAKLLANDGDFAGALIKFQGAYDASKDPRVLWDVAFCEKNLRHYSKVIATLERYEKEGATVLSAKDKTDAADLIATLAPFTTQATFRVNEAGAQIFVDDELIGTSPLAAPVVLDIGERHLRIVKPDFRPFEKTLPVGGSASVTVDVALVREVHQGKLIVDAPAGAAIFLDDQQIGTTKVEQTIPSGGHQLRVTAPGMHPYQTEIVVQDKETRSLNVVLEPEATAAVVKPMLRVAVGCGDAEPRGPEDGLVVYLDGPEVLPPGPVKQRLNAELGKNVVEHVEYPTAPGPHTIRISGVGCRSRDLKLTVDPVKGADVTGALESSRFVLFRGPQGSPGWFRAGLGLWFAGGDITNDVPEEYSSNGVAATGVAGEVGAVGRWFGVWLNGSLAAGSMARRTFRTNYSLPSSAHVAWDRFGARLGLRIPFNVVSFGFGPSVALEEVNLDQVRTGKPEGAFGAYAELDIQPLCDWGLFAEPILEKPTSDWGPFYGGQIGVLWGPSPECHKERETAFGLRNAP